MIVRCDNCGTEFGFDDRQVGEGLTVRCSVCKHVFNVESGLAKAPGWQVLTTDDTRFTAPDVATLREWIDEGRLHPDDQVSRTGRAWMRLGDMPEFAVAFARFAGVAAVAAPVREAHSHPPLLLPPVPEFGQRLAAGPSERPQSERPTLSPPRSPRASATPAPPAPPQASSRPVVPPPTQPQASSPGFDRATSSGGFDRTTSSPGFELPAQLELEDEPDEDIEVELDDEAPSPAARPLAWPGASEVEPEPSREPSREPIREPSREPTRRPKAAALELDFEDDRPGRELDDFAVDSGKRRGVGPGLIALLGVVAAVGVVFGVPSIRERVLNLGKPNPVSADPSAAASVDARARPELAAAEQALASLGTAALAEAEAGLQRAIDPGTADPSTTVAMKLALAELLVSRSLAYQIAAVVDVAQRADFEGRAKDDHEHAARVIAALGDAAGAKGADLERLAEVRALARLASGRPEVEVLPMVPPDASETKRIVQAAVLWRDRDAAVPPGLVAGLSELSARSGLGESALALALLRAGDDVAARNKAERLLVVSEDAIVGLAIRAHVGESQPDTRNPEASADSDAGTDDGADSQVAKAPPVPGGAEPAAAASSTSSGSSFDRLVERGCSQVSSGQAADGIKTLLRAFDIKPKDLDVLTCLADGYAAQGNNARAQTFYDRALEQSPSNIPALRGAAKIAAKTGADSRAKSLYERLLRADPNNATAQAYLAKHASKPAEPEPAKPEPAKPEPAEPTPGG
jgi:predicted Zn finger-like uncharacterized protein